MQLSFFVPGIPVAKGRPRARGFIRKNGKLGASMYTPDKTAHWENIVRDRAIAYAPPEPIDKPIRLQMDFYMPKPKSAKKRLYPSVRPDVDNLSKALMDAMNGIIWADDALVCQKHSSKYYATEPSQVGVSVEIKTMEGA